MPDWVRLRDDFPITKKYAYLANAAIAPIPMPVYTEVSKFYQDVLNRGQTLWDEWEIKMEQTRDLYTKFIGADNREEIAFTHSTSEGMNIIAHMLSDKGMVISNELEFPSSNLPWINKNPINIKFVKATDHNKILIIDIVKMVDQNDKAAKTVVTSHVQYSTGFRQDLEELGKLTKQKGLYFVVNPTQSLGALFFNVKDFGIDFMASNGHKWILSCFGIGTIYIKGKYLRDIENFKPSFFSQFGQKRRENFDSNMRINTSSTATKFELATPHFPNIIALNAAVRYISKIGIRHIEKRILNLTDYLIDNLQKMKLEILSPIEERKYRSGIILFKARNKNPIDTVIELEKKSKIIVSARGNGIRVSTHFYNNE
ncbi:MAG TPA: aminotransferase class V-fold PLP-dependent enzyme, partial [Candidatus Nitrosopolaris rasttigaisensis]|nr:aminotransferase class V-fold PLP-dependent enzyme [Candidatus Nitrosopolaris rasttigaisensis]